MSKPYSLEDLLAEVDAIYRGCPDTTTQFNFEELGERIERTEKAVLALRDKLRYLIAAKTPLAK